MGQTAMRPLSHIQETKAYVGNAEDMVRLMGSIINGTQDLFIGSVLGRI